MITMISVLAGITHGVARALARISLRLIGYYLLPWARATDRLAALVMHGRLQEHRWWGSAAVLCVIVALHLLAWQYFGTLMLEVLYVPPVTCVCEATTREPRHEVFFTNLAYERASWPQTLVACMKGVAFTTTALLNLFSLVSGHVWMHSGRYAACMTFVLYAQSLV